MGGFRRSLAPIVFCRGLARDIAGDRANFSNGGEVTRLFADFAAPSPDPAFVRDARSYAPLVVHGPELEAARRIVSARLPPSVSPPPPHRHHLKLWRGAAS
jgi:hypothetical protein